jgi:C4-dicarboxylate transporter, DctM subunit
MDPFWLGLLGVGVSLVFILIGIPVAMALGTTGVIGLIYLNGVIPTLQQISLTNWSLSASFVICCVPLFIFMGQLVFHSGVAADLYYCFFRWLGWLPGGLSVATAFSCCAFGAVSGSSVATVATMGSIAIPEMKKYGYADELATGSLAASGTMGTMVPPSIDMIFYGILTGESIGKLFMGGFLPGLLEAVTYSIMIVIRCIKNPKLGPKGPPFSMMERIISIKKILPILFMFFLILGGLYSGFFTGTEAAGVGCFYVVMVLLVLKKLSLEIVWKAILDTGKVTAMILALLIGGLLFSRFLTLTDIIPSIVSSITSLDANRYVILTLIIIMYIIMGCALNTTTMLILTLPITYPILTNLGFSGIWFGIMAVKMCEIGMITPPIGANLFVMKSIAPEIPMSVIVRGVTPFVFVDFTNVILLVLFPSIALFLPDMMF